MHLPPSDHVVWKLVRLAVIGALFICGANVFYKNGWSTNDIMALATLLLGVGGFDQLKSKFAPKPANKPTNGGDE